MNKPIPIKLVSNEIIPIVAPTKHKNPPNSSKSVTMNNIMGTIPDKNVLEYVQKFYSDDIILHERDEKLAQINKKLSPTLLDSLEFYESKNNEPDAIMVLNIESPLRGFVYIDKAVNVMRLFNIDSVVGVTIEDDIFYTHNGNGLIPQSKPGGLKLEREVLYKKVGGMSLVTRKYFKKTEAIFGGRIGHIQLDKQSALIINSYYDWRLAELLIKDKDYK